MLDKGELKRLLKEENYREVLYCFYKEYQVLVRDFLIKNGVDVSDSCFELQLFYLQANYPEYKLAVEIIRHLVYLNLNDKERCEATLAQFRSIKRILES